jgi:integrase/recombinase XerC
MEGAYTFIIRNKMPKTIPIPCTKEEMDKIVDAAINDDFFYMLFKVARKTGRRLGEYYDVKVKDINFERGIMMTKVLKRRQKIEKEAILDEELMQLIKRYIAREKLKLDDYLFRKVGYRQIQNKIAFYSKKAEIPHKVSFHNFRHYFVTELFKKGWTYDKIAKLTGHSSVGTLVNYDHTVASDLAGKAREDIKDI